MIDPYDYNIGGANSDISGFVLGNSLNTQNVSIITGGTAGQGHVGTAGDVNVIELVFWSSNNSLTLSAYHDVNVSATIHNFGTGNVTLRADNAGVGYVGASNSGGRVNFIGNATVILQNETTGGYLNIYYNPTSYLTPIAYTGGTYLDHTNAYMLINQLGTSGDGVWVHSLAAISNNSTLWNKRYALGTNINAAPTSLWNAGAGFIPIGNEYATSFAGKFDGLGNTISNLYINRAASYVGLFGYVSGAAVTISNLNLTNVHISGTNLSASSGGSAVGSVIGYMDEECILSSIVVSGGSISASGSSRYATCVGGVVGLKPSNYGGLGFISAVTVYGISVSGSSSSSGSVYVGGFVGENFGTISTSSVSGGTVSGSSSSGSVCVGGFVGASGQFAINSAAVSNQTVSGSSTSGDVSVGGLVGYNHGNVSDSSVSSGAISGSSTSGDVSVGGLAGYSVGYANANSVSGGNVSGSSSGGDVSVGGLVGYNYGNVSDSSVSSGAISGSSSSGEINVGGVAGINEGDYWQNRITGSTVNGSTISGRSSSGTVNVGGVAGNNFYFGIITGSTVNSSAMSGRSTSGSVNVGGIVGCKDVYDVYSIFSASSVSGGSISGSTVSGGVVRVGDVAGSAAPLSINDLYSLVTAGNILMSSADNYMSSVTLSMSGSTGSINQITGNALTISTAYISAGGLTVTGAGAVVLNDATTLVGTTNTIQANNGNLAFTASGQITVNSGGNLYLAATSGNIINNSTQSGSAIVMNGGGRYILWSNQESDTVLNGLAPGTVGTLGTYNTRPPSGAPWTTTATSGSYIMFARPYQINITGNLLGFFAGSTYTVDLLGGGTLLGQTSVTGNNSYTIAYNAKLSSPFMVYVDNRDYGGYAAPTYVSGTSYDISKNLLYSNVISMSGLRSILTSGSSVYAAGDLPYSYVYGNNNIAVHAGVALRVNGAFTVDGNITTTNAAQTYGGAVTALSAATLAALNSGGISFGDNITATNAGLNVSIASGADAINVSGIINAAGRALTLNASNGAATAGHISLATGAGTAGSLTITARPLASSLPAALTVTGAINDTYSVYDYTDLGNVRNDMSSGAIYNQLANINASGSANFVSIGDGMHSFMGKYDGHANTISNLTINQTAQYVGLFGYVSGANATISNLNLINANITGYNSAGYAYVGGVAGYSSYGTINGATVSNATISGSGTTGNVAVGNIQADGLGSNKIFVTLSGGTVVLTSADNYLTTAPWH